jgi:hypothetical protein
MDVCSPSDIPAFRQHATILNHVLKEAQRVDETVENDGHYISHINVHDKSCHGAQAFHSEYILV